MNPGMRATSLLCGLVLAFMTPPNRSAGQVTATWHNPNIRSFQPGQQIALSVQDEDVRANVDRVPFPFFLKLQSIRNVDQKVEVHIPYEVAQLDQLSLWRDEILIRGMANNAIAIIVIFNKNTGEQIDEFTGYWPAISLKGGLILFSKSYPSHFAGGTEDHYMVYRLNDAPAENRAPGSGPLNSRPVGLPLYPPKIGNETFDNVNLKGPLHAQAASGFFWNDRGDEALTMDEFDTAYQLVLFRFQTDEVRLATLQVNRNDVCGDVPTSMCHPVFYLENAALIAGDNGKGSVTAIFGSPSSVSGSQANFPDTRFVSSGSRSLIHPRWTAKPIANDCALRPAAKRYSRI